MVGASHELAVGFLSEPAIRLLRIIGLRARARRIRRALTAFRQGAHVTLSKSAR
jgi:hypothetical protein